MWSGTSWLVEKLLGHPTSTEEAGRENFSEQEFFPFPSLLVFYPWLDGMDCFLTAELLGVCYLSAPWLLPLNAVLTSCPGWHLKQWFLRLMSSVMNRFVISFQDWLKQHLSSWKHWSACKWSKQMSGEKQGKACSYRGQCLYGKTKSPRQTQMKVFLSYWIILILWEGLLSKWVDYNF